MVTIRPATAADVPRIVELVDGRTITSSSLQEGRQPTPRRNLAAFAEIEAAPGITLLVAEDSGETIGTVVLLIVPSLSHGGLPWAKVEHMVVAEDLRGQSIGNQLMEYAITRSREVGCYKMELTSDNRRPEAHSFYRSLGFEAAAASFRRHF